VGAVPETHGYVMKTEGPPRYYLPICVKTPLGFMGGPSGYVEVGADERDRGPVIVEETNARQTYDG